MYRRYIVVGVVFFLLIGAYFIFFDKNKSSNDYEKYYSKLVEREEYKDYLDDVNVSIEEVKEDGKYSYIVTFDGVTSAKENVKILVLDEKCNKDEIEFFPSFGIVGNFGYSLVTNGNEDEEAKKIRGVNLTIIDKEKIDNFIIYFNSNGVEEFAKISVSSN